MTQDTFLRAKAIRNRLQEIAILEDQIEHASCFDIREIPFSISDEVFESEKKWVLSDLLKEKQEIEEEFASL